MFEQFVKLYIQICHSNLCKLCVTCFISQFMFFVLFDILQNNLNLALLFIEANEAQEFEINHISYDK